MMYVIARLAPEHPSGCVYWDGWTRVENVDGAEVLGVGGAETGRDVRMFVDADVAAALALWLNTSPALKINPLAPPWQAVPIPAEFGSAA